MSWHLKPEYIKLNPKQRLHQLNCPIIGLTGGIASGKSTFLNFFKTLGMTTISADQLIKEIYELTATKEFILKLCPQAVENHQINFSILRTSFFSDHELKSKIEHFLYGQLKDQFLKHVPTQTSLLVYEVPLLFEKKLEPFFDLIITLDLSPEQQKQRALKRDPSSPEVIENIMKNQLSRDERSSRSDVVVTNNGDLAQLQKSFEQFKNQYLFDTKN